MVDFKFHAFLKLWIRRIRKFSITLHCDLQCNLKAKYRFNEEKKRKWTLTPSLSVWFLDTSLLPGDILNTAVTASSLLVLPRDGRCSVFRKLRSAPGETQSWRTTGAAQTQASSTVSPASWSPGWSPASLSSQPWHWALGTGGQPWARPGLAIKQRQKLHLIRSS